MKSGINPKSLAQKLPAFAGVLINYLPFSIRLGKGYNVYSRLCEELTGADFEARRSYIISNFNKITDHFKIRNNFYYQHLKKSETDLQKIKSIDDITRIPLLNKKILREIPVADRTIMEYAYKQYNTGGTSGIPLSFYVEKNFYSREWAHMHYLWRKIGYKPTHTKITIRGKSLERTCLYNFNQNEFLINSYHSFDKKDYENLLMVFKRYKTEFIHGYPSSIYNFLKEAVDRAPFLTSFLKKNIKGIMFGSEFPSPRYRNFIEDLLTANTISWYGHTEGVILAGELFSKYEYIPFLSYGYAEAVEKDGYHHLVGTSFANTASPFIRYDTEDLITPTFDQDGLLRSFNIKEGRLGEFIIDKNNKSISLTALIFGRHHKLFDKADFIQVKQDVPGSVIVYFSSSSAIEDPQKLFDSSNLNIDLLFRQIKEPFKTPLGKIPLLIKN